MRRFPVLIENKGEIDERAAPATIDPQKDRRIGCAVAVEVPVGDSVAKMDLQTARRTGLIRFVVELTVVQSASPWVASSTL